MNYTIYDIIKESVKSCVSGWYGTTELEEKAFEEMYYNDLCELIEAMGEVKTNVIKSMLIDEYEKEFNYIVEE